MSRYFYEETCPHCNYQWMAQQLEAESEHLHRICPKCKKSTDTSPRHAKISKLKSPLLKKCRNPKCEHYYYGDKKDRYCCPKCAIQVENIRYKQYRKKWRSAMETNITHYMVKKPHAIVYLCNQAYHGNPKKLTVLKVRVTCKNCKKILKKNNQKHSKKG